MAAQANAQAAPPALDRAFEELCRSLDLCEHLENFISNPKRKAREASQVRRDDELATRHILRAALQQARRSQETRERQRRDRAAEQLRARAGRSALLRFDPSLRTDDCEAPSAEEIAEACRFSDCLPLSAFEQRLVHTPKIHNCVSVAIFELSDPAQAPLDLMRLTLRCTGSSYARKRFAAAQLAEACPRARVLVFSGQGRVGHMVVIGARGTCSARLALLQVREQLAAVGIGLRITSFKTINMVGASNLGATLNVEGFSRAHTDTVHYDPESFVGATWRPANSACCVEAYSTGRVNIPGARTQRDLLISFGALVPHLLSFSSGARADDGSRAARPPELDDEDELGRPQRGARAPGSGSAPARAPGPEEFAAQLGPDDVFGDWAFADEDEDPGPDQSY